MDLASHPDSAAYGMLATRSPLVRRLLARNPSPFTFTGTGTFVVGPKGPGSTVAVIDPGPNDPAHIAALLAGLAGERVSHIVITHTHMDHSPGAPALKAATGALIVGCAPLVLRDDGPRADAGFDASYAPDRVLTDGESVSGPDWTLTAVHTPGHTSNHLCYALEQEKALFTGDHVMGWSTTVVAPPDGDMADYMASLQKLIARDDAIYHPTHGEAVTDPQRFARHLLSHRRQRETQILRGIDEGLVTIPAMVAAMYAMVDKRLHPAAGRSVLAHLIDLEQRGQVVRSGDRWAKCGES
ncbi:MBL fold metallo-hydrolase [Sandarakinorhabdus sp.]|uniref:MBL fold metallo-hydrolase n=1 Tax=Sandarakinorhabdus sp. TaxID=1916663 RepID=UPI00333F65A0